MDIIKEAFYFAASAHKAVGQVRKHSKLPYIVHPLAVSQLIASVSDDRKMIAASLLHDVEEDTLISLREIEMHFGEEIALLVDELSDKAKPSDGNRAERKALDRERLKKVSYRAKSIKLADMFDNMRDIVHHDPKFARVYLREKRLLLDEALYDGHPKLIMHVDSLLRRSLDVIDAS